MVARTPGGAIEAVESADPTWPLPAVQWHPEMLGAGEESVIFAAFVEDVCAYGTRIRLDRCLADRSRDRERSRPRPRSVSLWRREDGRRGSPGGRSARCCLGGTSLALVHRDGLYG